MADCDGGGGPASGLEMLDVGQLKRLVECFFDGDDQPRYLDYEEFVEAFGRVMGDLSEGHRRTLEKLFTSIDADASGSVGWRELAGYFSALAHNEDKLTSHASRLFHDANFLQPPAQKEHYHRQKITRIVVHDALNRYFTAGDDGKVKAWDAGTLDYVSTLHNGAHCCTDLCLLPRSDLLAVSSADHLVTLYYPKTGKIKASFKGKKRLLPPNEADYTQRLQFRVAKQSHIRRAAPVAADPDQRPLLKSLRARENNLLQRLWAAEKVYEKYEVASVHEMSSAAMSLGYCSTAGGGEALVVGLQSGHVQIYDLPAEEHYRGATYAPAAVWQFHTDAVTAVRPSTTKESIITASLDSNIHVINAERGSIQKTLHGCNRYTGRGPMQRHQKGVYDIDVSVDLKLLVSVGLERQALVWNPFVSTPLAELGGHMDRVVSAKFNTNENEILTLSLDDTVRIFDVRTYRVIQQAKEHYPAFGIPAGAMTYDAQRQTLITATSRLYTRPMAAAYTAEKAKAAKPTTQQPPGAGGAAGAAGTADAGLAALAATPAHPPLVCVCVSHGHGLIVGADVARMVRVWDAATMKVIARFEVDDGVAAMCLDKDERRLCVANTAHGGAQVWNIRNGGLMRVYLPEVATTEAADAVAYIVARQESDNAMRLICVAGGECARLFSDSEGSDAHPWMVISLASVGGAVSMTYVEAHEAIVFGTPRAGCAVFNLSMLQSGPSARMCAAHMGPRVEELVAFRPGALQQPIPQALLESETAIGLVPPEDSTYNPASPFHASSLVRPAARAEVPFLRAPPAVREQAVVVHQSRGSTATVATTAAGSPRPALGGHRPTTAAGSTPRSVGRGALPPLAKTPRGLVAAAPTTPGELTAAATAFPGEPPGPAGTPAGGVEEIDDIPHPTSARAIARIDSDVIDARVGAPQPKARRRLTGVADSLSRLENRVEAVVSIPWAAHIVVTAEGSGSLKMWHVRNLEELLAWRGVHGSNEAIYALAVDATNKFLVTGDETGYVTTYDISGITAATQLVGPEDVVKRACIRCFDRGIASIAPMYSPYVMYVVSTDQTAFLMTPEGGFLSPVGQPDHLVPADAALAAPLKSYHSQNYLACMRLVRKQQLLDYLVQAGEKPMKYNEIFERAEVEELFITDSEVESGLTLDEVLRELLRQMNPDEVELRDARLVELTVEGEYRLAERLLAPAKKGVPTGGVTHAGGVALMALSRMQTQAGLTRVRASRVVKMNADPVAEPQTEVPRIEGLGSRQSSNASDWARPGTFQVGDRSGPLARGMSGALGGDAAATTADGNAGVSTEGPRQTRSRAGTRVARSHTMRGAAHPGDAGSVDTQSEATTGVTTPGLMHLPPATGVGMSAGVRRSLAASGGGGGGGGNTFLTGVDLEDLSPTQQMLMTHIEFLEEDEVDARDLVELKQAAGLLEVEVHNEGLWRCRVAEHEKAARAHLSIEAQKDLLVRSEPAARAGIVDEGAGFVLQWRVQFAALLRAFREEWEVLRPLPVVTAHEIRTRVVESIYNRRGAPGAGRRTMRAGTIIKSRSNTVFGGRPPKASAMVFDDVIAGLLTTRRSQSNPPPVLSRKLPPPKRQKRGSGVGGGGGGDAYDLPRNASASVGIGAGTLDNAAAVAAAADVDEGSLASSTPTAIHGEHIPPPPLEAPGVLLPQRKVRARSHPRAAASRLRCVERGHVGGAGPGSEATAAEASAGREGAAAETNTHTRAGGCILPRAVPAYDPRAPRTVGPLADEAPFDTPDPRTGRPAATAAISLGAYFNELFQRVLERALPRPAAADALDDLNAAFVLAVRPIAMRIVEEAPLPDGQKKLRPLTGRPHVYAHQGIVYKLVTNPAAVEYHRNDPLLAMKPAKIELKAMSEIIQSGVATVPLSCAITYKAHRVWVTCGAPTDAAVAAGGEVKETYAPVPYVTAVRRQSVASPWARGVGAARRRSRKLSTMSGSGSPGTFGALVALAGLQKGGNGGGGGAPLDAVADRPASGSAGGGSLAKMESMRNAVRRLGVRAIHNLTYGFETAPNALADAILQVVAERVNLAPLELSLYPGGRVHDHFVEHKQRTANELLRRLRATSFAVTAASRVEVLGPDSATLGLTDSAWSLDLSPASSELEPEAGGLTPPVLASPLTKTAKAYRKLEFAPLPPAPVEPAKPAKSGGKRKKKGRKRSFGGGSTSGSPQQSPQSSPQLSPRGGTPSGVASDDAFSLGGSLGDRTAAEGSDALSTQFQPVVSVKPPPQRAAGEEFDDYVPPRKTQHLVYGGMGSALRSEARIGPCTSRLVPTALRYYVSGAADMLPLQPPGEDGAPVRRYNPIVARGSPVPMMCCSFCPALPNTIRGKADRVSTKVGKRLIDAALPDCTSVVLQSALTREDLDGVALVERLKAGGVTCAQFGALGCSIEELQKSVMYNPNAGARAVVPRGAAAAAASPGGGGGGDVGPRHMVSMQVGRKSGNASASGGSARGRLTAPPKAPAHDGGGGVGLPQIVGPGSGTPSRATTPAASPCFSPQRLSTAHSHFSDDESPRAAPHPHALVCGAGVDGGAAPAAGHGIVAQLRVDAGAANSRRKQKGAEAVMDALIVEMIARVCREILCDTMYVQHPRPAVSTTAFEQSLAAEVGSLEGDGAGDGRRSGIATPVESPRRRGSTPVSPAAHSQILFKAELLQTYHTMLAGAGSKHRKFFMEAIAPRLRDKYKKVPKTVLNMTDLSSVDSTRLAQALARKSGVSVDAAGTLRVLPVAAVLSLRPMPMLATTPPAVPPAHTGLDPMPPPADGWKAAVHRPPDDPAILRWMRRDLEVSGAGRSMRHRIALALYMGKRVGRVGEADGSADDVGGDRRDGDSSLFDAAQDHGCASWGGGGEPAKTAGIPRRQTPHFNVAVHLSRLSHADPFDHAEVLYDVGTSVMHADPHTAVALLHEAWAIYEQRVGLYHTATILCIHHLARACLRRHQPSPTNADYRTAADLLQRCVTRLGVKRGKYPTLVPPAGKAQERGRGADVAARVQLLRGTGRGGRQRAGSRKDVGGKKRGPTAATVTAERIRYENLEAGVDQHTFDTAAEWDRPLEAGDATLLEVLVDELVTVLIASVEAEQARPDNQLPRRKQTTAEFVERTLAFAQRHALGAIDRRSASGSHFLFNAWYAYSRVQILKEASSPAVLQALKQAAQAADVLFGPTSAERASVLALTGTFYQTRQNDEMCVQMLTRAVAMQRGALGGTHVTVVKTYLQIAAALQESNQPAKALEWVGLAERTIRVAKSSKHPLAVKCREMRAVLYRALGQLPRAIDEYEAVLTIKEQQLGAFHPACVDLSFKVAELFVDNGDIHEALDLYTLLYRLCTQCYGTGSVHHARALKGSGICQFHLDRLKPALANFRRAIELYEPRLHLDFGVVGELLFCLLCTARISYAMEAYTDAIDDLERCLNFDKDLLGTVEHSQQDEERALLAACRQRRRERLVNDNEKDRDHKRQRMLRSWLERIGNRLCKPALLGASKQGKVFFLGDRIGDGLHVVE